MRGRNEAIDSVDSVEKKASIAGPKPYDEAACEHAKAMLQRFVDQSGSQRKAAARLNFDSSRLSRLLSRDATEQPQLSLLLELRREMKMSLDQILGLEPIGYAAVDDVEELEERLNGVISALRRARALTKDDGKRRGGRKGS